MRTQEAAIKTRAVTFRPRRSTGPRPEHSEGAGGGCPQWPGEPPPQTPRLHWPCACLWGPVPPGRKRNKRKRRAPPPRCARIQGALRCLLSWGPGPLLGRGWAFWHPRQAALLRQRPLRPSKNVNSTFWPLRVGRPGRGGGGVAGGTKASARLRGGRSTKPPARPDLGCESADQPAPHPRELGDGTLKTPSEKEGSQGDKCQLLSRAAQLLPHKKDAVPLQLPGCHGRRLGAGDPTWSLRMGSGVAA